MQPWVKEEIVPQYPRFETSYGSGVDLKSKDRSTMRTLHVASMTRSTKDGGGGALSFSTSEPIVLINPIDMHTKTRIFG